MVHDEPLDNFAEYAKDPEDLQDANYWGRSQYKYNEDFEEGEDDTDQEEVCMSSMWTVRLHMMHRVPTRGEIMDMTINSCIAEPNNRGPNNTLRIPKSKDC